MNDDGRLVAALEVVTFDGEAIHTMPMSQPTGEFSRRLERVMGGMLRNMRDDCFIREVYAEEADDDR